MKKFKISVVIPVYNSDKFIKTTLLSILEQTYSVDEIIIINDLCTDDTMSIINDLLNEFVDVKWLVHDSKVKLGPGLARNIGINLSANSIIAFCDSDDIWDSEKIRVQVRYLEEFPIISSSYIRFNSFFQKQINLSGVYKYNDFLKDNFIAMSSALIDLNRLDIGQCRFKDIVHEDYLFWLDVLKYNKDVRVKVLSDYCFFYRVHENNYSKGFIKKIHATFLVYRYHQKNFFASLVLLARRSYFIMSKYLVFFKK